VWFYDATNGVLLQPAPYKIKKHTLVSDKFFCEVQTPYNCSTLRMIFHCATSTTTAWTIKIDDLLYGPQAKLYGSAVTDWVSYTPTLSGGFSNGNSNATISARYKRVGDSIEIEGKITVGSSNTFAASPLTISLPSGLSFDTSKIGMDLGQAPIGFAQINDTSFGGGFKAFIARQSTTAFTVQVPFNNAFSGTTFERMDGNSYATSTYPFTWANGDSINFKIESAPILGWSSSQIMSSDAATSVVAAKATLSANQTGVNPNNSAVKINFNSVTASSCFDTIGAYNTATYRYNVAVPGKYSVSGNIIVANSNVLNDRYIAMIYKNGAEVFRGADKTQAATTYVSLDFSGTIDAVAGDYIEAYLFGVGNNSASTLTVVTNSHFNISMLQGPAQIAASETVAVEYNTAAGGSISDASGTFIDFGTKESDTHGSVVGAGSGNSTTATSTWRFVAPISGRYSVDAVVNLVIPASTSVDSLLRIYKNGADAMAGNRSIYVSPSIGEVRGLVASGTVRLLAGDYISILFYQSSGASRNLEAFGTANRVSIIRTGNY
jgi:hypothetical protein